jgi:hypothetical protein
MKKHRTAGCNFLRAVGSDSTVPDDVEQFVFVEPLHTWQLSVRLE